MGSRTSFELACLVHAAGRREARRLLTKHGSAAAALAGLEHPGQLLDPEVLAGHCHAHAIRLLCAADDGYPPLLRAIPDAPAVLYVKGDPEALAAPSVAVVGARRCTRLGAEVAAAMAAELAERGICVTSGLARGIDSAAHQAAVGLAPVAAVLGHGLARVYPASSSRLAGAILDAGGVLMSEYPPLVEPRRHYFPERNRLISGISLGVVVVEAGEESGSLITARMAAEQGRDVFAVPGPITSPVSRGCHRLLKQGAALVECAADVIEGLGLDESVSAPQFTSAATRAADGRQLCDDPLLGRVLAAVAAELTPLDQVVADTGLAGETAAAALVELELSGFVRAVPGGYIRRPSR